MKTLKLSLVILISYLNPVFSQGYYISLPARFNVCFYDKPDTIILPSMHSPWIVSSDRSENPLYNSPAGTVSNGKTGFGKSFLVTEQSGNRVRVVEADKVITNESNGSWVYRTGIRPADVLRGWISMENLVLSRNCLKFTDCGVPHAPKSLYSFTGFYRLKVHSKPGIANEYPDSCLSLQYIPFAASYGYNSFGYVYKVVKIMGRDWYLLGNRSDIRRDNLNNILIGWISGENFIPWKNKLAIEYNWEFAPVRRSDSQRLAILKDPHDSTISLPVYQQRTFIEKEFNYFSTVASENYYFQRALGSGFRSIVLNADENLINVGVMKNSKGFPGRITDPAIEIANQLLKLIIQPKIIFILDGTGGLEPVANEIYNAVSQTVNEMGMRMGSAVRYKFGACIYRDKGYGPGIFQNMDQLSDYNYIIQWFNDNLPCRMPEKENPPDFPEAVFYGLNEAFKQYNPQRNFFNPVLFVLIGDCGNHERNDETRLNGRIIQDTLVKNVIDLVAIQFEHRKDKLIAGKPDNGKSWDLFRTQFREILSVFGQPETRAIEGGTKEVFKNRPGSFIAYPERGTSFTPLDLSRIIKDALINYDSTIRQKVSHSLQLIRDSAAGNLARVTLKNLTRDYIGNKNIRIYDDEIDQIMELTLGYLEELLFNSGIHHKIFINNTLNNYSFIYPGFVTERYQFLNHPPYKHVIYLNNIELEKTSQFLYQISLMRGLNIRNDIVHFWQYLLVNVMGMFQNMNEVNDLTISEATSVITGYNGLTKYDRIRIGEIPNQTVFTNELLLEYIFELSITYGYLQSIKRGSWELRPQNINQHLALMNAILRNRGIPMITPSRLSLFSERLIKKDIMPVTEYFRDYPYIDIDVMYGLKAYWVDADYFAHEGNDFTGILTDVSN